MKRIPIYLIYIISFIWQTGYCQKNNIQELGYFPENITENDTIIIFYSYTFPYQPCIRDSFKITTVNDTSTLIDAYYSVGDGTSPCYGLDSISLGRLLKGWYSIIFRLSCTNRNYSESDTIILTVNVATILTDKILKPLRLFPNPSRNQIILNGILEEAYISIRSIYGREVLYMRVKGERQIIDISGLNPGVYIITINDKAYNPILSDKIIVQ